MTLFRIPEKAKANLILAAAVLAHLNRVAQTVVKIIDDSDVTVAEALQFTQSEGTIWLGKWRERQSETDSAT